MATIYSTRPEFIEAEILTALGDFADDFTDEAVEEIFEEIAEYDERRQGYALRAEYADPDFGAERFWETVQKHDGRDLDE